MRNLSLITLFLAIGIILGVSGAAMAQDDASDQSAASAAGPNQGRVSLSVGFDITNFYLFRGIPQENAEFIIQPYTDIGFDLHKGDGLINSLDLNVGTWNSFHSNQTGASEIGTEPDSWYESDLYAGITMGILEDWETGVVYNVLTSPNDAFATIHEIQLSLGYDDSGLLGDWALSPTATMIFEVQNQADNGDDEGIYLELGFGPSFTFNEGAAYPVTLSIPVKLGFSVDDYYENGIGDDDTFGYLDLGLGLGVPLAFIPDDLGDWEATASVHLVFLGDSASDIGEVTIDGTPTGGFGVTDGDDVFVVGLFGVSMSY